MAELNNKINILVSADASQADRVLRSVTPSIGQHGRTAGDQWGRGFSQASEKWMRAIGGVLRRFGGEFGRQAAEGLETFDRFSKAREATRRAEQGAERAALRGVGREAVGEVGGTALGQGLATAAGAGVGARYGIKTPLFLKGDTIEHVKAVPELYKNKTKEFESRYGSAFYELSEAQKNRIIQTSLYGPHGFARPKKFSEQSSILMDVEAENSKKMFKAVMSKYANVSTLGIPKSFINVFKFPVVAGGALLAGLAIPTIFFTHMAKAQREIEKLAKEAGLMIGVFRQLKDDKEFLDIWKKYGEAGVEAARKIGEIKDATERNKEAVKEFGDDGINVYHKLIAAGETYKKALDEADFKAEGLRFTWATTGEMIVGWFKKAKDAALSFINILPGGIGADLAREMQEGQAAVLKMQAQVEDKRKKQAQDVKTDAEKAKKIADDQEKLDKQKQDEAEKYADTLSNLNDEINKYLDEQLSTQEQLNRKKAEANLYTKDDLQLTKNKIEYLKVMLEISKLQKQLAGETPAGAKGATSMFGFPIGAAVKGKVMVDESRLTLSQLSLLHPELKRFYVALQQAEMGLQQVAQGEADFNKRMRKEADNLEFNRDAYYEASIGTPDTRMTDYYKAMIQNALEGIRKEIGAPLGAAEVDPMVKAFVEHGGRLPIVPVMAP